METRKGLPRESARVEAWHAAVGADKPWEDVCEMQADTAKLTPRGLPRYPTKPSRVYKPLSSYWTGDSAEICPMVTAFGRKETFPLVSQDLFNFRFLKNDNVPL